ncbi:unnamed protein product [Sphagnum balticum]
MDNQFEEVVEAVMRRISECTDFPGDEAIYRRNSLVLTHNYQLAQLNDSPRLVIDPFGNLYRLKSELDSCVNTAIHGKPIEEVCEDVMHDVMPYSGGNIHPRFWGWVHGSGTVGGVIAEMMTATMNSNVGLCSHSGVLIERQVIEWMRQLFKFPAETGGGVFVSGTSMAAVVCLAVARYHTLNKYRMDVRMLKQMIQEDRQKGLTPFCIIGNAGTVSTGAFDDLAALSAVAKENNIWFHVDGAFGSFVVLDPSRQS